MKVTRVGGRISRDRLPPGGQANHGWLAPRGATCPGGKINWDTGPDQMPHNVGSDQGLHCLLTRFSIKKKYNKSDKIDLTPLK